MVMVPGEDSSAPTGRAWSLVSGTSLSMSGGLRSANGYSDQGMFVNLIVSVGKVWSTWKAGAFCPPQKSGCPVCPLKYCITHCISYC